jgi:DNA (cytosine-5)-methyltransferase 1
MAIMAITLGSLFDGISAFPLAAIRNEIKPIFTSEIDKYAVSVSRRHFPDMAHLGDITKIKGSDLPPTEIVCAGFPCQSFSLAAGRNRTGLAGKSGLFGESIRLIEEMRNSHGNRIRFVVFENVPGMLTARRGEDFRIILQSIAQTFCKSTITMPENRRWKQSGTVADGSLAWRVLDALDFGALKDVSACSLSSILMEKVPSKYYLSPYRCKMILERAKKYKKLLPKVVTEILTRQSA